MKSFFFARRRLMQSKSNYAFNIPAKWHKYPATQKGVEWKATILPGEGIKLERAVEQTGKRRHAKAKLITRIQESFPGGYCQRKLGISIVLLRACRINPKTCFIEWREYPNEEIYGFIPTQKD